MTADDLGMAVDIPGNKSTVAAAGSRLVGDVTVDNMGLAVGVPGDKITVEVIEFAVRTDDVRLITGVITDDVGLQENDVEADTADSVGTSCEDATADRFGFL